MIQPTLFGLTLQERFERYHAENPHIYAALVELAWTWKRAGRKRCGIKMLWERLRWELGIQSKDEDFALNNNFHARFVRLIIENEPELASMFELRQLKAE